MRYFLSGIAGAGMNPLAQLLRAWGHDVRGSDRGFDAGAQPELAERLCARGVVLVPQDGLGVSADCERFVCSTAVEDASPEMQTARQLGIPMLTRPQLLAEIVNAAAPGVAIAGTSGKSTVTGMLAWILRRVGRPTTILGGAALAGEGTVGGVVAGPQGGLLIAEACESDGTLIGYRPTFGLVHNISRDHAELDALTVQFATFAKQCATLLINTGCAHALALADGHPRVIRYGTHGRADVVLEVIAAGPHTARGVLAADGVEVLLELPQPGAHNLENACAAVAVARALGIPLPTAVGALADFPGVFRRFQVLGVTDTGIRVVDDFAHNGEKIRAALTAAQSGAERVLAVFQPHGFGPARFLRPELRTLLPRLLRPQDRFCYAEIFYAGGSVTRDLTAAELAADIGADCAADHAAVLQWCAEQAQPGDTVLLMGARDPALPRLAQALVELL